MRKQLLFLAVLAIVVCCSKREPGNDDAVYQDSLSLYIEGAADNKLPVQRRVVLNDKALKIVLSSGSDSLRTERLFGIASNYFNLQSSQNFFKTTNLILNDALEDQDTLNIAKSYIYLGEYFKSRKRNDSAFSYFIKAEKFYRNLGDAEKLADLLVRKADLQAIENDFFGSEKSALDALSLLRISTSPKVTKIYEAYNLIGISANELNDYTKAVEYFNKALTVTSDLTSSDKTYYQAISLNNIGNAYQNMGDYPKAIEYFNMALRDQRIKTEYADLYAIILDNLAYSKFKLQKWDQLPDLFYTALKIHTDLRNSSKVVLSNIHLSEYYAAVGDSAKAQEYSEKALALARVEKFPTDVLAALKQLSAVDIENASLYSAEYIRLNDSLRQTERSVKDRFARIAFETEEISLKNDKLEEQNRTLLYFFASTFLVGLLLFVIRFQRAKNRELLLKQAQQKANEDIYNLLISQQEKIEESRINEQKKIARDLHDGVLGRLFGARLNLDSLNKLQDDAAVLRRGQYLAELKKIEEDIREISHDLNREKFELINNFVAILNNFVEEQRSVFKGRISLLIDERINWEQVNNFKKINLYRVIQESFQNINKYSRASSVQVQLHMQEKDISLQIVDDGIGFTLESKKRGIGIINMESRITDINGRLIIETKRGSGTKILAIIPLVDD